MNPDPDYEAYQLIVPLMDVITRWSIFSSKDREKTRSWVHRAGFNKDDLTKVNKIFDLLDKIED